MLLLQAPETDTSMKWRYLLYALLLLPLYLQAQPQLSFKIQELPLTAALAEPENQCSGMSVAGDYLYLLPENRLREIETARLYRARLTELDRCIGDKTLIPVFNPCPIVNLDVLARRIAREGSCYEGLEALCINGTAVYCSVETTTASPFGYLLKGHLRKDTIYMDTSLLLPLPKPASQPGTYIYNAGFESLYLIEEKLHTFFEYNYFEHSNHILVADTGLLLPPEKQAVCRLPFRLTDMTATGTGGLTGINYFYKGTMDSAYRAKDPGTASLIRDSSGYHGYCRLVHLEKDRDTICWNALWTFPPEWRSYNWEGIAAYKGGYFIINDKYTVQAPFRTVLLYLSEVK